PAVIIPPMRHRVAISLLALTGLVVAACGGDDDDGAADPVETTVAASPTTEAPATDPTDAADDTAPDDSGAAAPTTEATSDTGSDAPSDAFPVTIEHKYGETTIEEEPERVVAVGFTDQDTLLALGVVPVGIRDWYGDQPFATW